MLNLYSHPSGSGSFEMQGELPSEVTRQAVSTALRVLHVREETESAELLKSIPFVVMEATNDFNDEFRILHATLPLERYEKLRSARDEKTQERAFKVIAKVISEFGPYIRFITVDLEQLPGPTPVTFPDLHITSEIVERALADAEQLLHSSGATSGVDRAHTALHGYLRAIAKAASLPVPENVSSPALLKLISKGHPAFTTMGPRTEEILNVLRSLGSIIHAMDSLRNQASVAHPNDSLLPEPEAMLFINAARSVLHYIDSKVRLHAVV